MTPSYANSFREFSRRDWWEILKRLFTQINADNVGVAAAGVAFFTLLSIFPLISAGLSTFGYFADPAAVNVLLDEFNELIPRDARTIINDQVEAVTSAPQQSLGFGILVSLTLALYSAGAGIRALMRALNIAYGEVERRAIWKFYLTGLAFTLMVGAFMAIAFVGVVAVPFILGLFPDQLDLFGLGTALTEAVIRLLPFIAVVGVFAWTAFMFYRFGPDRRPAKKRWIWPGVALATVLWLAISWGFGAFVSTFADYNATYGSIASVIVLLMWMYLSAFVVIMGAELNAEMERQTLVDTTRGPAKPLGIRGANMADFLPDGLGADDVEVDVVEPVVRPRHIRGTDVPEEKLEEDITSDGEAPEPPKTVEAAEAVKTGAEV